MKSLDISHIVLVKEKGREHTKVSALFVLLCYQGDEEFKFCKQQLREPREQSPRLRAGGGIVLTFQTGIFAVYDVKLREVPYVFAPAERFGVEFFGE